MAIRLFFFDLPRTWRGRRAAWARKQRVTAQLDIATKISSQLRRCGSMDFHTALRSSGDGFTLEVSRFRVPKPFLIIDINLGRLREHQILVFGQTDTPTEYPSSDEGIQEVIGESLRQMLNSV
jgi:hypothetical protein